MKLSGNGRLVLACVVSIALMLGMSACGGGTIGYLWVLAGKSSANTPGNVLTGYKIDNYTGNLTEIVNSPFPTASDATPVYAVHDSSGRYVYVLNQNDGRNSVVVFSVGGDGVLTLQPQLTQATVGATPVWMDINGGYLYVLDSVSMTRNTAGVAPACSSLTNSGNTAPCGSVEVFQITPDTGQLTTVLNTTIRVNNVGTPFFPVGPAPTRLKAISGALLVVNGDGTVTSFTYGAGGQLTTSANSTQVLDATGTSSITSITSGNSYVYLTDGANNRIFQYTVSNGVLQPVNGSPYANSTANTTPVWTLTVQDGPNAYLYVLNSGTKTTLSAAGSISPYQITTNGMLAPLATTGQTFKTGGFPVCLIEDPSNQYIYSSNADGTVTGYQIRKGYGTLNDLTRGASFTAAGTPTCLVTSGILS